MNTQVLRYDDYMIVDDFYSSLIKEMMVTESNNKSTYKEASNKYKAELETFKKKYKDSLKINTKMILLFSTSITAFSPIVEAIIKNTNILSNVASPQTVLMLSLASIIIVYDDVKNNNDEHKTLMDMLHSIFEELQLNGIGQGIVKKIVRVLKMIMHIFNVVGKRIHIIISNLIEMFAYTALMFPIMNSILYIIDKYTFNIDTTIFNLKSLIIGCATLAGKYLTKSIIDAIKANRKQKNDIEKDLNVDVEDNTDIINEFGTV